MATLTVTTTYDTAQVLTEAQLDAIRTPIETHFNTAQVEGSNIQANILDGATYLADDAISAVKLASNSVTTAKLVDSTPSSDTGITTAKINDNAVTTAKLDDLAITAAKIADANVTTAKIADDAVPKLVMLELPTASTNLSDLSVNRISITQDGSETLVGSLTFSGLTSGKHVIISSQSISTSSGYGYIGQVMTLFVSYSSGHSFNVECALILKKDVVIIHQGNFGFGRTVSDTIYLKVPLRTFVTIDTASSTSHTYSLYIKTIGTTWNNPHIDGDGQNTEDFDRTVTGNAEVNSAKLVAIQLL